MLNNETKETNATPSNTDELEPPPGISSAISSELNRRERGRPKLFTTRVGEVNDELERGDKSDAGSILHHRRAGVSINAVRDDPQSYPEQYEHAVQRFAAACNRSPTTIGNCAAIARHFTEQEIIDLVARSNGDLTRSHFVEASNDKLTPADRTRLMNEAVANNWSVLELRDAVHATLGVQPAANGAGNSGGGGGGGVRNSMVKNALTGIKRRAGWMQENLLVVMPVGTDAFVTSIRETVTTLEAVVAALQITLRDSEGALAVSKSTALAHPTSGDGGDEPDEA